MSSGDFDQHQLDNDFRQACSLGNINEVKRNIVNKIVDINVADKYESFTGLHFAAEHGHDNVVEFLVENNANVNCINSLGETPLIISLKLNKKSKTQIDINKRTNIIKLLLKNGANLDIGYSKDINNNKYEPKAIHIAVVLGNINIIRLLLNKSLSLITSTDKLGRYPIHYAAEYNQVFAMQELLANGAILEPKDNNGYTPFHIACDKGHLDIVQFFLDQGGHMHSKTKNGDQGLHIACRHKVKEIVPIVEFLINQGADRLSKDSQNKCLKNYIKDNILLKNVISNAKKTQNKYANTSSWSWGSSNNSNSAINKSASIFSASHNNMGDSFAVLDLKGERLYSSHGYKMDNKGKKLDGTITLYEHGLLFSFKKGFISKTTVEEFYPWKPFVELISDINNNKLLKVEFPNKSSTDDEKKNNNDVAADKFGIKPCRPNEITETIQKEINKMFPTYSLQNDIKKFIKEIGDEKTIQSLINEYNDINKNLKDMINESNDLKSKLNDNPNDNNSQTKYDKLVSEINTISARINDIETNCTKTWNECETIINNKIEPLINDLCINIDNMIMNNEHWKLIANVRKSLSFAKEYKKKLINIRTLIRDIIFKNDDNNNNNQNNNINYSTI